MEEGRGSALRSAFAGGGHTGALSNGLVVLGPHELGRLADLAGLQGQEDVSGLLVHAGHDLFGAWKTWNTKPSLLRNHTNIQIYRTLYGLLKTKYLSDAPDERGREKQNLQKKKCTQFIGSLSTKLFILIESASAT